MRKYSVIRNFKKFKKEYPYFVVFIMCKDYYYTFDSDAKIMMYIFGRYVLTNSFRINKVKFKYVVSVLNNNGLNVVLAGWKNTKEYYSPKENKYIKIKSLSKQSYKQAEGALICE